VLDWSTDLTEALPAGPRAGADVPYGAAADLSSALEEQRRSLLPAEVDRYAELGRDAAEAVTDVCGTLSPSTTEQAVAAGLASALLARGIDPVVLLVAGGDRVAVHRHPLPTGGPVGHLVMVVVCGRRHGLIANLTRFVATRPLPARLAEEYTRLLEVDVAYNAATRPGSTVGDCCAAGMLAYSANGFEADEWTLHHQGGPTGYFPREYLATAGSTAVVADNQPFAWNPSVPSLKVEDTVLGTGSGPRVLTVDPRWPTVEVRGLARPGVLELS
jgi:Xaa-Pro aminopeptidase